MSAVTGAARHGVSAEDAPDQPPAAAVEYGRARRWSVLSLCLLAISLACIVAIGLGLIRQRSSANDGEDHAGALQKLLVLRHADTEWTVEILKVRAGMSTHYDALTAAMQNMLHLRMALQGETRRLGVSSDAMPFVELDAALMVKVQSAERIKMEQAILRNSVRFMPTHLADIARQLQHGLHKPAGRQDGIEALEAIHVVQRELFNTVNHGDASARAGLKFALQTLQTLASRPSLKRVADDLALLETHAEAILERNENALKASNEALGVPTAAALDRLEHRINEVFRERLAQAQHYRTVLLALALLLCPGLLYASAGWWRSYHALRHANVSLAGQLEETRRLMHHAAELRDVATHDHLTGLPNRRLLEDRLGQELAHAPRHASGGAVVFADLDGFKRVNDTHGHAVGDKLLAAVAERFKRNVRECDTVGRFGGDEFVLILTDTGREGVARVAAASIADIESLRSVDGFPVQVSASLGIAFWEPGNFAGLDGRELLYRADVAMYLAKREGKGCSREFMPQDEGASPCPAQAAAAPPRD